MTVTIPVQKATQNGLRFISDESVLDTVIDILNKKPRVKSGTWNRRAQEYEQKINSGDLLSLAEVVRDTYREGESLATQSYSERDIFVKAFEKLVTEIAAVRSKEKSQVVQWLNESCNRRYKLESDWVEKNRIREKTPDPFDPNRHDGKKQVPVDTKLIQRVVKKDGGLAQPRQPSSPPSTVSPPTEAPAVSLHKEENPVVQVQATECVFQKDKMTSVEPATQQPANETEKLRKIIRALIDKAKLEKQALANAQLQAEQAENLLTETRGNAAMESSRLSSTINDLIAARDLLIEKLTTQGHALTDAQNQLTEVRKDLNLNRIALVRSNKILTRIREKVATAKEIRNRIKDVRKELLALIEERTSSLEIFAEQGRRDRATIAELRAQLRAAGHEPCS